MENFKGTKGEWLYKPFEQSSNGYINVYTKGGSITVYECRCITDKTDKEEVASIIEEAEANAKLIAASKDLLEALVKTQEWLKDTNLPQLVMINNAINKAIL